jgi:hypothetical protein
VHEAKKTGEGIEPLPEGMSIADRVAWAHDGRRAWDHDEEERGLTMEEERGLMMKKSVGS